MDSFPGDFMSEHQLLSPSADGKDLRSDDQKHAPHADESAAQSSLHLLPSHSREPLSISHISQILCPSELDSRAHDWDSHGAMVRDQSHGSNSTIPTLPELCIDDDDDDILGEALSVPISANNMSGSPWKFGSSTVLDTSEELPGVGAHLGPARWEYRPHSSLFAELIERMDQDPSFPETLELVHGSTCRVNAGTESICHSDRTREGRDANQQQSHNLRPGPLNIASASSTAASPACAVGTVQSPALERDLPEGRRICSNCGTERTPLWRRSPQGARICNACGLCLKARNAPRPTSLKKPPNATHGLEKVAPAARHFATKESEQYKSDESSSPSSLASSTCSEQTSNSEQVVSSKKEVIIKRILTWLDSRLNTLVCQFGNNGGTPDLQESREVLDQPAKPSRKRKRNGDEDPNESDDDQADEGPQDDETGNRLTGVSKVSPSFACPFLKHNFRTYRTRRCCAWSGWKTVHRVKEHVYRTHRLPRFRCNRCCLVFPNAIQLEDHQRSDSPCTIQDQEAQDGITEEQFLALRSRKRVKGTISEEEKWIRMYKIIFPDDSIIPYSYHDTQFQLPEQDERDSVGNNLLRDLGDHARRELPRLMRPRLNDMLDRLIEEGLTADRVVHLAQGVFQQILQTFQPPTSAGAASPRDEQQIPTRPCTNAGRQENAEGILSPEHDELQGLLPNLQIEVGPSSTNAADPFPLVSEDMVGLFQETMIDSLEGFPLDIEDLLRSQEEPGTWSQFDSGYGSVGQAPTEGKGKGKAE